MNPYTATLKFNLVKMSRNDHFWLTLTSLCPDSCAPKHSPVDIAPHPEYKSNTVFLDSWTLLAMQISLVIGDDASMLTFEIPDH